MIFQEHLSQRLYHLPKQSALAHQHLVVGCTLTAASYNFRIEIVLDSLVAAGTERFDIVIGMAWNYFVEEDIASSWTGAEGKAAANPLQVDHPLNLEDTTEAVD